MTFVSCEDCLGTFVGHPSSRAWCHGTARHSAVQAAYRLSFVNLPSSSLRISGTNCVGKHTRNGVWVSVSDETCCTLPRINTRFPSRPQYQSTRAAEFALNTNTQTHTHKVEGEKSLIVKTRGLNLVSHELQGLVVGVETRAQGTMSQH